MAQNSNYHDVIRTMGILLVDPHVSYAPLLEQKLREFRFRRIFRAQNVEDALNKAGDFRKTDSEIRVVVIDLEAIHDPMPLVRKLQKINSMAILALTPPMNPDFRLHGKLGSRIEYLSRPLHPLLASLRIEHVLYQFYLDERLRASTSKSEQVFLEILGVMARIIEARDLKVHNHSENVARLTMSIAQVMRLSDFEFRQFGIAGLLHDIGKMAIKDDILNKPDRLTEEEWGQVKRHPLVAATILEPIVELEGAIAPIRHHHEHFDGSGYPDGLAGEEIPIGAAIIHLAEAFDWMTTKSPYQDAKTPEDSIKEIRRLSGIQFHPDVVDAFLLCLETGSIVDPPNIISLLVS